MAKEHWSPCQVQASSEMLVLRPRRGLDISEKVELDHILQANPHLPLVHQLKE